MKAFSRRDLCLISVSAVSVFVLTSAAAAQDLFVDSFRGELREGWTWKREDPSGWRVTDRGLEIRVETGNMWGGANNARNVLVRPIPDAAGDPVEITVSVENRPTEQYEQVDLVWYYDDSHMVKIGQERVDGQLCIVMGREEKDRTRTIRIIPIEAMQVDLRFLTVDGTIQGFYRVSPTSEARSGSDENWIKAGECDLPVNGMPKVSLQVYQGPKDQERWARINDMVIRKVDR